MSNDTSQRTSAVYGREYVRVDVVELSTRDARRLLTQMRKVSTSLNTTSKRVNSILKKGKLNSNYPQGIVKVMDAVNKADAYFRSSLDTVSYAYRNRDSSKTVTLPEYRYMQLVNTTYNIAGELDKIIPKMNKQIEKGAVSPLFLTDYKNLVKLIDKAVEGLYITGGWIEHIPLQKKQEHWESYE